MKNTPLTILILLTLIFATGCAPRAPKYRVTVDAITAPNTTVTPNTSYRIEALGDETDKNSLAFQKMESELIKVLKTKGYQQAEEGNLAQETIYFDYGIEKVKEETQTYREPDITFGLSWGYPYNYYGRHYHPFYNDFWYGGYTTYRTTQSYYNRYITLLAKEVGSGKELWRVDVSSVGESKNLKQVVPILLQAGSDYMGQNTEEPVKLVLKGKVENKE